MRRRDFISIAGPAAAWPLAAQALGIAIPLPVSGRADEVIE